jgi:hypothetical protein
LEPDLYLNPAAAILIPGQALEAIDMKQIKWPGHGVSPYHTFQFVEGEYMKADEYDAFLSDPSDYALRTYMLRIYETLEPLKILPPLQTVLNGFYGMRSTLVLAIPEIARAFESLYKAALEVAKWSAASTAFEKEMAGLGFPSSHVMTVLAPFDLILDTLRGMRGAMLDMYRQPDKLLEVMEKVSPVMLRNAVFGSKMSGNPRVLVPLHRGSDGFMSLKQFETFYWPGLKRLILDLIDEGLTPIVIWEGKWTEPRLEYLAELPKGKILGLFQDTDLFKAKEIMGNTMCIAGNIHGAMFQTGTPEEIKDYSRKLIDIVGKDGGFIMAAGGVMDEAKSELVKVWLDFTKEYGVYR